MTTYHCQDCGCEVGHKGTKRCHSCAQKARLQREREARAKLEEETGDYIAKRNWWEIWERAENYEKTSKADILTCKKCGKQITARAPGGTCQVCAVRYAKQQQKLRKTARDLVEQIFVGKQPVIIRFPRDRFGAT